MPARSSNRRRAPQQERSRQKVDEILRAARKLLEKEGAEALNTNRIAREAGVGVGSLYEYFPNKEAIARELIRELAEEEASQIMQSIAGSAELELGEAIPVVVRVVFDIYARDHRLFDALWSMRRVTRTIGHRPGERLVLAAIRERLGPEQADLHGRDVDLVAFTAFHMVESLTKQMVSQRSRAWSNEACAAEISLALTRYLGLERAGSREGRPRAKKPGSRRSR